MHPVANPPPGENYDHVVSPAGKPRHFLTSDQCFGRHSGNRHGNLMLRSDTRVDSKPLVDVGLTANALVADGIGWTRSDFLSASELHFLIQGNSRGIMAAVCDVLLEWERANDARFRGHVFPCTYVVQRRSA